MVDRKIGLLCVAPAGDSFQGRNVLPAQATQTAVCMGFDGSDGIDPATSGVTGRHGATGYSRLRPGITGWSRRFRDERTGCDRPRPGAARPSLCGRRVVGMVPTSTTLPSDEHTRTVVAGAWRGERSSSAGRLPVFPGAEQAVTAVRSDVRRVHDDSRETAESRPRRAVPRARRRRQTAARSDECLELPHAQLLLSRLTTRNVPGAGCACGDAAARSVAGIVCSDSSSRGRAARRLRTGPRRNCSRL
jgi:hypothetical protein